MDSLSVFEVKKAKAAAEGGGVAAGGAAEETAPPGRFGELMEELLEGPYTVVDIMPEQVPAERGGRYFSVEKYYLADGRIRELRSRYAGILLRLNCYYPMAVSFDGCTNWEDDPDPEAFADRLRGLSGNGSLRAVFEEQRALADIEPGETWMTVYDPGRALTDKLGALARAEGLFVWAPPQS